MRPPFPSLRAVRAPAGSAVGSGGRVAGPVGRAVGSVAGPAGRAVGSAVGTIGSEVGATVGAVALAMTLAACGGGAPQTPQTTTVTITPTPGATTTTSGAPTTTATTTQAVAPPKTYAEAMQHLGAGKIDTGAKATFTSPTGNIYCSIAPQGGVPAGCELRDGRVKPPAGTCDAGGGGAQDVGRIEWADATPKAICNSDTMSLPGAVVLQYGSIARVSGSPLECLSETIGMTCVNTASQKGFFLAKGTYTLF